MNNCGTTPLARPVHAAMIRFLDGYAREGLLWPEKTYPGVKAAIYRRLAALLKAGEDEFALIHHTAEGMNFISHGLALKPGDEILLLENEYPSNVYPWEHWREKGVTLKTVACGATPDECLDNFTTSLSAATRVAALSAVHWCTGMPLPLAEIGRICAERGVAWVVDGSQGVGLLDLDVKACGIGYMAFSGWKWLLGPVGLGVLYVTKEKLDGLKPVFKGTESVRGDAEYLPYKSEFKPGADRFAYSTGNFNDWIYFEAALDYLAGIGIDQVRERILFLAGYLSEALRVEGWRVVSDAFPGRATGIVAAEKSGVDSAAVVKALKARRIVAAERLGRIRFSPHICNSTEQLDRTVRELAVLSR